MPNRTWQKTSFVDGFSSESLNSDFAAKMDNLIPRRNRTAIQRAGSRHAGNKKISEDGLFWSIINYNNDEDLFIHKGSKIHRISDIHEAPLFPTDPADKVIPGSLPSVSIPSYRRNFITPYTNKGINNKFSLSFQKVSTVYPCYLSFPYMASKLDGSNGFYLKFRFKDELGLGDDYHLIYNIEGESVDKPRLRISVKSTMAKRHTFKVESYVGLQGECILEAGFDATLDAWKSYFIQVDLSAGSIKMIDSSSDSHSQSGNVGFSGAFSSARGSVMSGIGLLGRENSAAKFFFDEVVLGQGVMADSDVTLFNQLGRTFDPRTYPGSSESVISYLRCGDQEFRRAATLTPFSKIYDSKSYDSLEIFIYGDDKILCEEDVDLAVTDAPDQVLDPNVPFLSEEIQYVIDQEEEVLNADSTDSDDGRNPNFNPNGGVPIVGFSNPRSIKISSLSETDAVTSGYRWRSSNLDSDLITSRGSPSAFSMSFLFKYSIPSPLGHPSSIGINEVVRKQFLEFGQNRQDDYPMATLPDRRADIHLTFGMDLIPVPPANLKWVPYVGIWLFSGSGFKHQLLRLDEMPADTWSRVTISVYNRTQTSYKIQTDIYYNIAGEVKTLNAPSFDYRDIRTAKGAHYLRASGIGVNTRIFSLIHDGSSFVQRFKKFEGLDFISDGEFIINDLIIYDSKLSIDNARELDNGSRQIDPRVLSFAPLITNYYRMCNGVGDTEQLIADQIGSRDLTFTQAHVAGRDPD